MTRDNAMIVTAEGIDTTVGGWALDHLVVPLVEMSRQTPQRLAKVALLTALLLLVSYGLMTYVSAGGVLAKSIAIVLVLEPPLLVRTTLVAVRRVEVALGTAEASTTGWSISPLAFLMAYGIARVRTAVTGVFTVVVLLNLAFLPDNPSIALDIAGFLVYVYALFAASSIVKPPQRRKRRFALPRLRPAVVPK